VELMKRMALWAVVGAGLGDLVGMLIGGKMISYWVRPPGVTDQDRCVVEVDAALGELVKVQGAAAVVGLVLFVILGIVWGRRSSAATRAVEGVK
jgi:hypothetical protein